MASKTVTGSILSCNLIKRLKDTKLFSFFLIKGANEVMDDATVAAKSQ